MPRKVFENVKGKPTLKDVARLIENGKAKRIVIACGAGISTSAAIPDFRSPGTGLYDNLQAYDLPDPQAIFEIGYFIENPQAFFTLAKELYPGNFRPTLSHAFFTLLDRKGLLLRCYTQNIDCLERMAGLPEDRLVEAHGSFATARCLRCRHVTQGEELKPLFDKGEVIRCEREACRGKRDALIKSDIVFFGEGLPNRFFELLSEDMDKADLLIVMGTSLQVQPFASIVDRVGEDCPRVLINLESVGEMDDFDSGFGKMFGRFSESGFDFQGHTRGGDARDVQYLGHADKGVIELTEALGWKSELEEILNQCHEVLDKKYGRGEKSEQKQGAGAKAEEVASNVAKVAAECDSAGDGDDPEVEVGENVIKGIESLALQSRKEIEVERSPTLEKGPKSEIKSSL